MILSENLSINNVGFVRHYSDSGKKIRQVETDVVYDEAVDVLPCRYTYEETNEPILADEYTEE